MFLIKSVVELVKWDLSWGARRFFGTDLRSYQVWYDDSQTSVPLRPLSIFALLSVKVQELRSHVKQGRDSRSEPWEHRATTEENLCK